MATTTTPIPASTWVILPAYNESKHILDVIKKVNLLTDQLIVIDDGSHDDTAEIARTICDHVLVHTINLGKGAALKTGCEYAFHHLGAEQVILMDADDQHDAAELPAMVAALGAETPIVLGVRQLDQAMPFLRRMGSKSVSWWIKLWYGTYIPDVLSGYRAIHHTAYPLISWNSARYGVETEMVVRIIKRQLKFSLVPIKTIYHDYVRGMSLLDALDLYAKIVLWRLTV